MPGRAARGVIVPRRRFVTRIEVIPRRVTPPRALIAPPSAGNGVTLARMRRSVTFAFVGLALAGCTAPPGEDPSLLIDRVWVDSVPDKPTDHTNFAYLIPEPAIGIFQRASSYEMRAERFDHRRDGKTLELTFPQSGKTAKITFTVTACSELPPFDLCLDLSDNPWGGPKRYYGTRAQDEDDAARRRLRSQLGKR